MKYLKLSTFDLHKIDFKTFTFPKLAHTSYTDRNGQNEMETIEHVWTDDENKLNLFYNSSFFRYSKELADEVRIWNNNPERHWKELLIPLLEEKIKSQEKYIEEEKKSKKATEKALKKLKGEK